MDSKFFFNYVASILLPEHGVRIAGAGVTALLKNKTGVAAAVLF